MKEGIVKKSLTLLLTPLVLTSLVSCGPKKYTVVWQNYDETVLETDLKVKKGEMPQYDGETPTRETDETYVYEFTGWSPELTEVSEDAVYVATFKATPYYHISFVDYDNAVLYEATALEGETPEYKGNNPEREEDDQFSYEFNGWNPSIEVASKDTTYVATYTPIPLPVYHVIFVNYDDSILYETDVVKKQAAIYSGETPTKPEDDEFTYEFDGWDQDLSHIYSDVTTKAIFKDVAKENWGPIHWF